MIVKSGKSSSGSPMCSGLHSAAESAPVLLSASGATTAAVTADAAVPPAESFRPVGRRIDAGRLG
jgi:hypothetical protein